MAAPGLPPGTDIQALLAALTASQHQQQPQQQAIPGYPPAGIPQAAPGLAYHLPQPTNTGSVDLSQIRPVNSGSVNLADAMNKARNFSGDKGVYGSHSPRDNGRSYRRSRSRSRSPRRDNYSSYRDDRRDDSRRGGARGRSRSPHDRYSPAGGRGYGRDRTPPRRDDEDTEVINVESSLVGLVIGRAGENLRRVEKETGARIQFITPPDHKGPVRQCRIQGSPRARDDAKREINRIIDENKEPSNPRETRGGGAGGAGGAGRAPAQAKPTPVMTPRPGESSMQIMVPDRTVGLIIGRGGETIRDLQQRSDCHINILGPNQSVNGLRPVNLIGQPDAAQHAKNLIMEIVESDTRGDEPAQPPPRQQFGNDRRGNGNAPDGSISEIVRVPPEAVGMIIGKSGDTIREMQAQTGCKINVTQNRNAPPDADREINLTGSRQAVDAARAAVMEKVDAVREKGASRGRGDNSGDRYGLGLQNSTGGNDANTASAADPYAAYGGYQNYIALWYTAMAQGGNAGGAMPQPPGGPSA